MCLEIFPGLLVIRVVLNKTGIVESSIVNLEDVLLALAPLETVGDFQECEVVSVDAVGNAGLVTAEVFHSVLAHEYSKFFVKLLLGLDVGLDGRYNGLEEALTEFVSKSIKILAINLSLCKLLLKGSLRGFCELKVTSTGVETGRFEVEAVRAVFSIEAVDSAILVALRVGFDR